MIPYCDTCHRIIGNPHDCTNPEGGTFVLAGATVDDAADLRAQLATVTRERDEARAEVARLRAEPPAAFMAPSHPTTLGDIWIGETCPDPETFAAALAARAKP